MVPSLIFIHRPETPLIKGVRSSLGPGPVGILYKHAVLSM